LIDLITAKQWDELNQFVETVEWDLIFDLFNYSQTMGRIKPVCGDSRMGSDI
jgi:hypothetical protein